MRSRRFLPVVFAGLAATMLAQTLPRGVQKGATMGGITEYDYPNGLRVLLLPDPSAPKVTVNITYLVGSRHEGYGETGMAHLLEHMNFILTTSGRDIKKELSDRGAQWNGTTYYDRTNYFETFTAGDENLKWALGLEADRMVNTRMEKALLDTEMTVVRNEFEQGENSPQRILEERVISTAYLWHNYGKSTIGSRADIEKVPIDRLAAFYRKYYQPDNAVLVIAGQFDSEKALSMTAATLGAIPRPARKLDEPYTVEPVQDGERFVELRRVGGNPTVMAAWHAPALAHADSAALEVLVGILEAGGGGRGGPGTGRLYKALVDNKKATSVNMDYEELHDPGFVAATATLSQDQSLEEARKVLLETIANVANEPPSKEEVDRAKARIVQGMETAMNNSQRAAIMLTSMIASGDWRLYFVNYEQLKAVTVDDVVRVAKLYFKPSNRTVGEYIPTAAPDRTEVPAAPSIEATLRNFKTTLSVSSGEAFDPSPANIEKHVSRKQLANGMKLILLPKTTRGETVNVVIELRFGDAASLAGKTAAGEMAGALLMRGTKTKSREDIQNALVKLDAQISVSGGPTRASASIQVKQANLIPALQLAAEILREPAFPDSELEQVRKQRLSAIESRRTAPEMLASLTLERSMHTYPRDDVRYVATFDEQAQELTQVSLDDVKKFYTQFYGASHGAVAAVGQFDPAQFSAAIGSLFESWTSPSPYQRIVTDYQKNAPVNVKIETPDKQNATYASALDLQMSDTDPDYPAIVLANYMLGGELSSRIPNRIRNVEGLSYGVYTRFAAPAAGNSATFRGLAISNPNNTPKVESSFRDELEKTLAGGFQPDEIATAKKSIHDQRVVGRSQESTLAGLLLLRDEFGRTMQWDEQMDAKLEALTADQVNAAFRRHIHADQLSVVKAGDFKAAGAYPR